MSGSHILPIVALSVKISLLATLANLPIAFVISWVLARYEFRGKSLVDGIVNLPLVMPPVTIGYLLLFLLGKQGILGSWLFQFFGLRISFTTAAAVIAAMVVSFPLLARSLRISLEMVDQRLESCAATLGASRWEVLVRVTLPLAVPGLINGLMLGFARSLGEFGATMVFAGNIGGETRTIPLAVYSNLQVPGYEKEAMVLVIVSIVISFSAMSVSKLTQTGRAQKRRGTHAA